MIGRSREACCNERRDRTENYRTFRLSVCRNCEFKRPRRHRVVKFEVKAERLGEFSGHSSAPRANRIRGQRDRRRCAGEIIH